MGFDPGYGRMGFWVIYVEGSKIELVDYGVSTTTSGDAFENRLLSLANDLGDLFAHHQLHALAMGLAQPLVDKVAAMILATKFHEASDPDTQAVLDIDLTILGESSDVFDQFERDIRREYDWVVQDVFRLGRAQILRGSPAREQIYHTSVIYQRLELQARHNLSRRIRELETQP
ncbi:MAG: crossover junction endodeoxyribonuclease RuvC [Candidatus Uhrbacteria bacterium]|nr:crossover junction endodeoxyribonuclease RuvC [Candidatus Uhrbacteria bacterium]